ncbi:peptide ABC transporter permease [Synergistales bacterium]|nr:peptide ABC transporter permease [Synergistales bacterium]
MIFRRIGGAALVLLIVVALNFFLFRVMPGDPLSGMMDPKLSAEAKDKIRAMWGLDKPLGEQFFIYVGQMATFNFGMSMTTQRPVWDELRSRVPNTVALLLPALLLSAALGIYLGVKAAVARGSLTEKLVIWSGAVSFSVPSFFVQIVLLMCFAYTLPLFPLRGSSSIPPPVGATAVFDYLWHLSLPLISLVALSFGGWALYIRNMMVKTLGEDYILMAVARGLPKGRVVWNHAFRSILPPVLTMLLLSLPGVVSGAVLTETVFSLNGAGSLLLEAVNSHNYPVAQAAFYIMALLTVLCNLLADLLCALADPRVRLGGEQA